MYRKLVSLHGIIGLLAAPLLISYAFTALLMVHNLRIEDEVQEHVLPLAAGADIGAVLSEHGFVGEETGRDRAEDGLHIAIHNPATSFDILVGTDEIKVRETRRGTINTLRRLHERTGFWHEDTGANVWGLASLLASLCCLTLAATGLAMWWKRTRERKLGLIFLSLSSVYAVGLLVLIRLG